jgi:hypothetical protein
MNLGTTDFLMTSNTGLRAGMAVIRRMCIGLQVNQRACYNPIFDTVRNIDQPVLCSVSHIDDYEYLLLFATFFYPEDEPSALLYNVDQDATKLNGSTS